MNTREPMTSEEGNIPILTLILIAGFYTLVLLTMVFWR